jgi:hypothetical protein
MAGYYNYSKSNNAIAAERNGRYPASHVAKMLGVPVAWVRLQGTNEWHHTSARYNVTNYYDLETLQEHLDTPEGQEQLAQVKAEVAAKKRVETTVLTDATVRWVEWTGFQRFRKAVEHKEENATVTYAGGKFVTVKLACGREFKKGKDTYGFAAYSGGKRIWF